MGLERFRVKTPRMVAPLARSLLCIIGLLLASSQPVCDAFNLDVENPTVYSGPKGSYFGYAVDFYLADSASASLVIGAPKANTRQVNVTQGGSVFYCPWSIGQSDCHNIEFDAEGDRTFSLNDTEHQVDFKSHQWFGATVRSHGDTILACAPLYSWRTEKDIPHSDATGNCYLSVHNFTKFVEYAPCRTEISEASGQGYCQGGFSADFTTDGKVVLGGPGSYYWQGQVISAAKEDIIKAYYPGYFIQSVGGQIQTRQELSKYDDSYQGYSVATGEFSGDQLEDFVAGVPKGLMLYGSVSILNGTDLKTMINYTGEQMGSYFGYAVATTDINNDGLTDLLVGAPMFMVRSSDGRLEEMGRVYVYLQRGPLNLELRLPHLTGTQAFGRFGSTIAPLGDLNQDGFNDVAISCPFGGEDRQGLVYIYNGYADGLRDKPSQVIAGQWAAGTIPASFGFALRGTKDLDMNGYPDLIVGAFGVDKTVLYRSRPIVGTAASLTINPTMINPEEKNCIVTSGNASIPVSCVNLSFCISADGQHLPDNLDFQVEVRLDSQKHKQKGAVKRALFFDSQQPLLQQRVRVRHGDRVCSQKKIYLRDEKEFRDKLSPIFVAFNFSLDPEAAADSHGLRPILNYQTTNVIEQKAQIRLDCGEDNICVPDLKLAVHGDRKEVYLGDDNSLTLTFNAKNEGEGGAYEAELYVVLPPEADYSGIARNNESLTQLTCSYETENQTRYLSCDLGNPMKSGTSLWAGLRFTVPRLKDTHKTVQFDLQIRSKNENNSHSEVVPYKLEVVVQADVILQGVSRPDKVFFPPANWKVTKNYGVEQDVGPAVEHIYELVNNGPSRISHTVLELRCPLSVQGHSLLYPLEFSTEGPVNCTTDKHMNHLRLKLQQTSTEPPVLALKAHEHHVERRDVHRNQLAHLTNLAPERPRTLGPIDKPTCRCHIRVIDTFGTEPAYNHEEYATLHGYRTNWGYWNLNARQYMTMFPHTPDNSFMGFVSEELNETEKRSIQQNKVNNMAVVYGKEASMWKGKEGFLQILHRYMEVHGTVYYETQRPPEVPAFVKNHGLLPQHELQQLLRKAKLFIGFGFPYEGPAPLEAIANGCIFLQPKFHPPHSSLNHEFFRGKPTSREVSSQHPYAEQYIGKPHVMTVDYNNSLEFDSAIREIMRTKVEPYLPYEYTCEGMLERVHAYIQHQDFCAPDPPFIPANLSKQGSAGGSRITGPLFVPLPNSTALGWASNVTAPPAWPPLSSLRLLVSQEDQSCVEACQSAGFICEPAHFRFINNKEALRGLEVQCEVVDSEINHILPAFSVVRQECGLQREPLLFSCAGHSPKYRRLCPCRDFRRGQVALCRNCL